MRLRFAGLTALLSVTILTGCARRDRERQIAECVDIQRTMYVAGEVRDCLVQRFGWEPDAAATGARARLGTAHPDSARPGDRGGVGR